MSSPKRAKFPNIDSIHIEEGLKHPEEPKSSKRKEGELLLDKQDVIHLSITASLMMVLIFTSYQAITVRPRLIKEVPKGKKVKQVRGPLKSFADIEHLRFHIYHSYVDSLLIMVRCLSKVTRQVDNKKTDVFGRKQRVFAPLMPKHPGLAVEERNESQQDFFAHLALRNQFRHPFIPTIFQAEYVKNKGLIYSEFTGGNTLKAMMGKRLHMNIVRVVFAHLILALHQIHITDHVYGGLSADSIQVACDGRVLLGNFNYSHSIHKETQKLPTGIALINTLPPEMLADVISKKAETTQSTVKQDAWALGVVVYQMATGEHPFSDYFEMGDYRKPIDLKPNCDTSIFGQDGCQMMYKLLEKNPKSRADPWKLLKDNQKWFNFDNMTTLLHFRPFYDLAKQSDLCRPLLRNDLSDNKEGHIVQKMSGFRAEGANDPL